MGCTWKALIMTTGVPVAVLMRNFICALTSISPATWQALSGKLRDKVQLRGDGELLHLQYLGIVDKALSRLDVWGKLARACLFKALDDGLRSKLRVRLRNIRGRSPRLPCCEAL